MTEFANDSRATPVANVVRIFSGSDAKFTNAWIIANMANVTLFKKLGNQNADAMMDTAAKDAIMPIVFVSTVENTLDY